MEGSTHKGLRLAGIALFAAAILLCQALIVQTILSFPTPFRVALEGIRAEWKGDRFVALKIPPAVEKRYGVVAGDILDAIEDPAGKIRPIRSEADLMDTTRALPFGRPFALHIVGVRPDGERAVRIEVPALPPPPARPWFTLTAVLPQILFCLLCVITALFIGFARPEEPAATRASLVFLCVATLPWGSTTSFFPPGLREIGMAVWIFPFSLATAVFMQFFLLFPTPSPIERKLPWLKRAGLAFGFVFGAWNYTWHYTHLHFPLAFESTLMRVHWVDYILDILFVACFLVGLASLVLNMLRAEGVDERRRCRLLLCGSVGIFPWLGIYITSVTVGLPYLPGWVRYVNLFFLAAFPLSFAYTVLRHRVFGVRVILRRGLRFALLSKGFLAAEAVLVFLAFYFGAMPLAAGTLQGAPPVALAAGTAGLTALVILGIRRLNRGVMPRIERHFFREAYDARAILTDLARSVRKLSASPEALFSTVTSTLLKSLHPDRTAVFLRGSEILRMPAGDPAHRALARGLARNAPGDYYGVWSAGPGWCGASFPGDGGEGASLPGDGAVSRRLNDCATRETPTALEIYPDNPRSWAATLVEFGAMEDVRFVSDSGFSLLVPLTSHERLLGFLALGEKLSEEPYSREDQELLLAVGQQMADSLEYADLVREGQEQAILRREVEIAREVQDRLLVQRLTPFPKLDYAGACRPARFVGGDYYDYIRCGESRMGFALGDVSGKGVSAALLMAGLQAALRVRADIHGGALEVVFSEINRHLCAATDEGRFATLFYGVFDPDALTLDYVNAGHNPPMLFRAGDGSLERLGATGPILGFSPESRFQRACAELRTGDLLVIFSDGVTEAMDESEEFYGEERLEALLRSLGESSADEVRDAVFADVDRFAGERNQNDDITLVVVRVVREEGMSDAVNPPTAPLTFPDKRSSVPGA